MSKYVLDPDAVNSCMHRLIETPVHRLFPGYLCLKQQSNLKQRISDLPFPATDFFDAYFRIRDADKPYFVPFTQAADPDIPSLWLNDNVSGTYAPSSLRASSPLRRVAEIEQGGHNSRWGLEEEHWTLARHYLCEGQHLPVESLAAFLFRDYAFETDDPSAYTLVCTFTEDFGYDLGGKEFNHLFETADSNITSDDFIEYE